MKNSFWVTTALLVLVSGTVRADCCINPIPAINEVNKSVQNVNKDMNTDLTTVNNSIKAGADEVKSAVIATQEAAVQNEQKLQQAVLNQEYNLAKATAQAELAARRRNTRRAHHSLQYRVARPSRGYSQDVFSDDVSSHQAATLSLFRRDAALHRPERRAHA